MKKHIFSIPVLILVTVLIVLFVSIFNSNKDKEEAEEGNLLLYYMASDNFSFEPVPYSFVNKSSELEMAKEALEQLKTTPEDADCLPVIPQSIVWSDVYLENNNLIIDFTAEYQKMDSAKEIFLRAGIVKTLVL